MPIYTLVRPSRYLLITRPPSCSFSATRQPVLPRRSDQTFYATFCLLQPRRRAPRDSRGPILNPPLNSNTVLDSHEFKRRSASELLTGDMGKARKCAFRLVQKFGPRVSSFPASSIKTAARSLNDRPAGSLEVTAFHFLFSRSSSSQCRGRLLRLLQTGPRLSRASRRSVLMTQSKTTTCRASPCERTS